MSNTMSVLLFIQSGNWLATTCWIQSCDYWNMMD